MEWLGDLEMPDLRRRLDIVSEFPVEKVTGGRVKRTVRRRNPGPKQRRPCFVCGRFRSITQSHHLVEVWRVASVLRAMAIYDWAPEIPVVSLCPNHHAIWHTMNRGREAWPPDLYADVPDAEVDRLVEVSELKDEAWEQVWSAVRREFLAREEAYLQRNRETYGGDGPDA